MKKKGKIFITGALAVAMSMSAASTVFAAVKYDNPSEALAAMTGKTIEEVQVERFENGKPYGQIATEAGVAEQFREEMLEQKKEIIQKRVEEGQLTPEKAEEIIQILEARQINCDGSLGKNRDEKLRIGFGQGIKCGTRNGYGNGLGRNR